MEKSQKYRLSISLYDRELILKYCLFMTGELATSIKKKRSRKGFISIELTLNEVSEMAGWIAMEANHTTNRQLEDDLSSLYERLDYLEYQIKNDH